MSIVKDILRAIFPPPYPKEVPIEVYKIVEVDSPRTPLQVEDEELRASIATLSGHPGFAHLLKKLALQNAALGSKLKYERHTTLDEVNFLQAGVYWSNWLQAELKRATTKMTQRRVDPMQEELDAFKQLDAQIERVGMDT
jgi:hypothetical protein